MSTTMPDTARDYAEGIAILEAAKHPNNWNYVVNMSNKGYCCIDTTLGSFYHLLDDIDDEAAHAMMQCSTDDDINSLNNDDEHPLKNWIRQLTKGYNCWVYSVDIVPCDEDFPVYYMGYWSMLGYLDRSDSYGPCSTCVSLAQRMVAAYDD